MPTFEFECSECEVVFEELLLNSDEITKYSKEHPCPGCGEMAGRIPSAANFTFAGKAGSDPSSGRASSGSHDLDYPSLDKAIGRSSNRKWKEYGFKKKARDQIRKETRSVAISESRDGVIIPTTSKILKQREAAISMLKQAHGKPGSK